MLGSEDPIELLSRWHAGDEGALHQLLRRSYTRLQSLASRLLGDHPQLRRDLESLDLVHSAAVRAIQSMPRFVPENEAQFVGLLQRILRNHLVSRLRSRGVENRGAYTDSVLDLRSASRSSAIPDRAAEKAEELAWARLALEFLEDDDRRLALEAIDGRPWREIAEGLGVGEDAARMRFNRMQPHLASIIRRLKGGQLDSLLATAQG